MIAESASRSMIPNRGDWVTMLMPLRMMYVSTPSGEVGRECISREWPLRGKIRVSRWLPGMMGTTGGSGAGFTVGLSWALIGQGGHGHGTVYARQGLEVGRAVERPGREVRNLNVGSAFDRRQVDDRGLRAGRRHLLHGRRNNLGVGGSGCDGRGSGYRSLIWPGGGELDHRVAFGLSRGGSRGRRGRRVGGAGTGRQSRHNVAGLIAHTRLAWG